MKLHKSQIITLVLTGIAVLIHLYAGNPVRVENQYATGIYPVMSRILRSLFGWLPFSFGDILYGIAILWLIWRSALGIKAIVKKQVTLKSMATGAGKAFRILLFIYIIFNIFWGINYNRQGIAEQLNLKIEKYGLEDLKMINSILVEKTNNSKSALVEYHVPYPSKNELFLKVTNAYHDAEKVYPFLKYQPVSLKPSIWSWVGNYMGFTGYYNPFTGEAQVNTLVPRFLQPFTSCHEVAHQLGYAKEMEANFASYLAVSASSDTLLQYSVYLDLFMYSNRNLFEIDSSAAKAIRQKLSPQVQTDLREWKAFNKKYTNPIEPFFRWIYGKYLEQNMQPQGVFSYNEVTGFIIAWYKKYGKI